ncbi:MAG: hypothetical protein QM346_12770 [Chloroflexota bacterium]|nr:hypothetical protein [Chloroflexota bacterium]
MILPVELYPYATASGTTQAVQFAVASQGNGSAGRKAPPDPTLALLLERLQADAWVSFTNAGSYQQLIAAMLAQADSAVSASVSPVDIQPPSQPQSPEATQRALNQAAKRLILQWLADESGYDEQTWPVIQRAVEENRLSNRARFHD